MEDQTKSKSEDSDSSELETKNKPMDQMEHEQLAKILTEKVTRWNKHMAKN